MSAHGGPRTYLALATTLVFWASAFVAIRSGLREIPPAELALLRFLTASTSLGVYALFVHPPRLRWRDVPVIALLGFLGITVYHLCLNFGEVTVTAGAASLLIAAGPIFTALFATTFFGERLRVWGWLGIMISFGGVALVALGEGDGARFDPRAFLIVLAALAASLYFTFQKPYNRRYGPLAFATYSIWAGTFFMLPALPGLLDALADAGFAATASGVYLGIFPGAIAYVTWTYALSRAPASLVTSFLYVPPVLTVFIGWAWLGEVPSAVSLAGGGVALAGVALVNARGMTPEPTPTPGEGPPVQLGGAGATAAAD